MPDVEESYQRIEEVLMNINHYNVIAYTTMEECISIKRPIKIILHYIKNNEIYIICGSNEKINNKILIIWDIK